MLQQEKADDYVIATGEARSVRDFCNAAFGYAGLRAADFVAVDARLLRPAEIGVLIGDAAKAKARLGWAPTISFEVLVREMVDADLRLAREADRWRAGQPGHQIDPVALVQPHRTGPERGLCGTGFAAQIACAEVGLQTAAIGVGDLDAACDFLDLRDVATAFALCIERGAELRPGIALNIASGVPRPIGAVLNELLGLSRVPIKRQADPARLRSSEAGSMSCGDASLARRLLGWEPRYAFADTLAMCWRAGVPSSRQSGARHRKPCLNHHLLRCLPDLSGGNRDGGQRTRHSRGGRR